MPRLYLADEIFPIGLRMTRRAHDALAASSGRKMFDLEDPHQQDDDNDQQE